MLERRQASRRREDHERDRLFALSLDLLAVARLDGRFGQLNASWEHLTGWTLDDLIGQPVLAHVHAEDQEAFGAALNRLRGGGPQLSFESRFRSKDGNFRWLEWNATPDPVNDAIYIAARDIMGRKLAEAESSRLAAIVESSNDAIISASLGGTIESWNPAAERIFGYRASDVLGRPLTLLVPRLSTDQMPQLLGKAGSGERVTSEAVERRRKDGTMVTVSLTISPVRDRAGKVVATSVIARPAAGA